MKQPKIVKILKVTNVPACISSKYNKMLLLGSLFVLVSLVGMLIALFSTWTAGLLLFPFFVGLLAILVGLTNKYIALKNGFFKITGAVCEEIASKKNLLSKINGGGFVISVSEGYCFELKEDNAGLFLDLSGAINDDIKRIYIKLEPKRTAPLVGQQVNVYIPLSSFAPEDEFGAKRPDTILGYEVLE